MGKKNLMVMSFVVIASIGLGFAVGFSLTEKGFQPPEVIDNDNNFAAASDGSEKFSNMSMDELSELLSNIMLPDEEYAKLGGAIHRTAMGLFMSQGPEFSEDTRMVAEEELRKSIDEKYSRNYFTKMNATSMGDLKKENLVEILKFYNTDSGKKFLKLSPKIIESTMFAVQKDLSTWMPQTVESLIEKLKHEAAHQEDEIEEDGENAES